NATHHGEAPASLACMRPAAPWSADTEVHLYENFDPRCGKPIVARRWRSSVDAAVNRQVRTVDVGRFRTGDERYQRCDLVRASIPIKRNGRLLACGPLA